MTIEVSNALPRRVTVEIGLSLYGDWTIVKPSRRLVIRNGRRTWVTDVPANGRAALGYTVREESRPDPDTAG